MREHEAAARAARAHAGALRACLAEEASGAEARARAILEAWRSSLVLGVSVGMLAVFKVRAHAQNARRVLS